MKPINLLIFGFGNIAQRHIKNISQLYRLATVVIVRNSSTEANLPQLSGAKCVVTANIQKAMDYCNFDIAVICSPGSCHISHANETLKRNIPTLVEKPLGVSSHECLQLKTIFKRSNTPLVIGYPLPWTRGFFEFKRHISKLPKFSIWRVELQVGQYLPDWRPNKDYETSVSAQKALGGGVLRELSHEFDYFLALFDVNTLSLTAMMMTHQSLPMDCENIAQAIGSVDDEQHNFSFSIDMNFLLRKPRRVCRVFHSEGLIEWDIIEQSITIQTGDNQSHILSVEEPFNDAYLKLIGQLFSRYDAKVATDSFERSINVMKFIEACESNQNTKIEFS